MMFFVANVQIFSRCLLNSINKIKFNLCIYLNIDIMRMLAIYDITPCKYIDFL